MEGRFNKQPCFCLYLILRNNHWNNSICFFINEHSEAKHTNSWVEWVRTRNIISFKNFSYNYQNRSILIYFFMILWGSSEDIKELFATEWCFLCDPSHSIISSDISNLYINFWSLIWCINNNYNIIMSYIVDITNW